MCIECVLLADGILQAVTNKANRKVLGIYLNCKVHKIDTEKKKGNSKAKGKARNNR